MKRKPIKSSTERHQLILKKLEEGRHVSIRELTRLTMVSGVTIRKDLKLLEDKNLLFVTRGGASISNPYAVEKPIDEKQQINQAEKQRIARAALPIIGQNDSILIGSGTTAFELARCLHPAKRLTVITPALKVALELCQRPNLEVLQLGGMIWHSSSAVTGGVFADRILAELSAGILFLGADGIHLDFGISITNLAEASLDQKMMDVAQVVVILADSSKFGRRGIGRICSLEHIQYIVTDEGVPAAIVKQLEEKGINVIIAK